MLRRMPKPPDGSIAGIVAHERRWRDAASASLLAFAMAVGVSSANAEPEDTSDPVSRLLIERGLVPARTDSTSAPVATHADQSLTERVRNKASDMVITAMNFLGVPYRRGGSDADDGFDCSGFTRHVFEMSLGLVLPRRVDDQAQAPGLTEVRPDDLRPGDLVFFNTLKRTFSHVGIYVGDGKFIHSPRSGASVRVEDMRYDYWAKRFTGARRASAADATDGR
jgi:cell wall-associated NlpC family hydrolase